MVLLRVGRLVRLIGHGRIVTSIEARSVIQSLLTIIGDCVGSILVLSSIGIRGIIWLTIWIVRHVDVDKSLVLGGLGDG